MPWWEQAQREEGGGPQTQADPGTERSLHPRRGELLGTWGLMSGDNQRLTTEGCRLVQEAGQLR